MCRKKVKVRAAEEAEVGTLNLSRRSHVGAPLVYEDECLVHQLSEMNAVVADTGQLSHVRVVDGLGAHLLNRSL